MSVTVTAFATVTASARSILGPLLTTFTPPRACARYGGPSTNLESGYQAQSCSDAIVVDDASCWPTASVSAPSPRLNGWGFYSPGTVCPSGYAVSCGAGFIESTVNTASETTSVPPNFDFQFPLAAGETAVGCCPVGFSCYKYTDSKFQTCVSSVTSGLFSVGYCDTTLGSGPLTNFQPEDIPSDVTIDVNPSHGMGGTVLTATLYAPMFQMNWQATDTGGSAATKTTPSIASATSTESGSSSSIADSTSAGSATPTSSPSSGLSTGAKAAIGVVVPVAVLALLGALGFWLFRRRRRNRAVAPESAPMSTSIEHYAPPYAPKQELDASMSRQELETPRPELRGDRAHRPPQELGP